MSTALVVAAHPDDEVLGCGGTVARLADEGWHVHVLIVAEGATSRDLLRDRTSRGAELSTLAQAAHAANAVLGVTSVVLGEFPDNRMDSVDLLDVVKVIEAAIAERRPSVVFTHSRGDLNVDHRVLHDAVVTACRPVPGSCVKELMFFEVASSTEWQPTGTIAAFQPNVFYDIAAYLPRKMAALREYAAEMRDAPHARSFEALEALAKWRGASSGRHAAEAFVLGRSLR